MTALFYWTGVLLWSVWLLGALGMVTLWVVGKMMARGAMRDSATPVNVERTGEMATSPVQARQSPSTVAPAPVPLGRKEHVTFCTLDELMPTVRDEQWD